MRDYVRDPIIESLFVHAPIERCWALSTRVELVQKTLGMKLAGGVSSGHVVANSRVVWQGWKFGLPTQHHTLITRFEPPHAHYIRFDGHEITKEAFFQDSQERGRFAFFAHDHRLREVMDASPVTELHDEIRFILPFGVLGRFVAERIMEPHIRKLAQQRFAIIKELAEGEGWREWIEEEPAAKLAS